MPACEVPVFEKRPNKHGATLIRQLLGKHSELPVRASPEVEFPFLSAALQLVMRALDRRSGVFDPSCGADSRIRENVE
jgi:hypothetical protein